MKQPIAALLPCLLLVQSLLLTRTLPAQTAFSARADNSAPDSNSIDLVKAGFLSPAPAARPGVYWYFMDGNRNREAMTADMESMKAVGLGSVIYLEVNVGIPRGPVAFLSDEWKELFRHAVKDGERLGIEVILGTGPGWAGSGGPWIKPEQSMQQLVASTVFINDSARASWGTHQPTITLPVSLPKKPFFGMGTLTPTLRKEWEDYYQDVAVLAFPTPAHQKAIADIDEKALYYRKPYTSAKGVKPYLPTQATYPDLPATDVIASDKLLDLTSLLTSDGQLHWTPPPGNWTIMRFVARNNGAVTRPAPVPGLGFEVDKMDTVSLNAHLDKYVGELLARTGDGDQHSVGGWKRLHIDSWEMGAQNWTPHFREEFKKRRGYDPLPYYPVYTGAIIGSPAISERFLWDLRQTCQEMILEYHAEQVKKYSHRHGLILSIEPYDMNPAADLELGAIADIPMCEFWSKGFGFNSSFSCIEATSIAHVNGIARVPSEAFTAQDNEGWRQYPGSMKNQGDWAFATGINQFMYHTFIHQYPGNDSLPGMTMGPYGVHWDRGQTWWPMALGYHQYIARCQSVLQQGRTVADILYLTQEGAPQVFRAPASALTDDPVLPDRKGYNFDGCAPGQLYKANVVNGAIVFPGGASYRLLVLPASSTMTPALLEKIRGLIAAGATVIGGPPQRAPGLSGYPQCDEQVSVMAKKIWGSVTEPDVRSTRTYGKGKIIWGGDVAISRLQQDSILYPDYAITEAVLHVMDVPEDFSSNGSLRYTHRTGAGWDIYFVSNKTDSLVKTVASFRVKSGGEMELWDPLTGESRPLPVHTMRGGQISLPLELAPYQSFFVVFREAKIAVDAGNGHVAQANFPVAKTVAQLQGAWTVSFDTAWGGPGSVRFDTLSDWSKNANDGIRYYSGRAHYRKDFDLSAQLIRQKGQLYLDLGSVKDLARVTLNGKDLGVVWTAPLRVAITGLVRAKGNHLDIEVANRWPNRLVGDEQEKARKYTVTTFRPYKKDFPLLASGLLGPVTVKVVE